MKKTIRIGVPVATALGAMLAWGAAVGPSDTATTTCLTAADVARHAALAREGISPGCNERTRDRHLARAVSR